MTEQVDWEAVPDVDEVEADAPLVIVDNNVAPLLNPPSPCSTCG